MNYRSLKKTRKRTRSRTRKKRKKVKCKHKRSTKRKRKNNNSFRFSTWPFKKKSKLYKGNCTFNRKRNLRMYKNYIKQMSKFRSEDIYSFNEYVNRGCPNFRRYNR